VHRTGGRHSCLPLVILHHVVSSSDGAVVPFGVLAASHTFRLLRSRSSHDTAYHITALATPTPLRTPSSKSEQSLYLRYLTTTYDDCTIRTCWWPLTPSARVLSSSRRDRKSDRVSAIYRSLRYLSPPLPLNLGSRIPNGHRFPVDPGMGSQRELVKIHRPHGKSALRESRPSYETHFTDTASHPSTVDRYGRMNDLTGADDA